MAKYKSKLEANFAATLKSLKLPAAYEKKRFPITRIAHYIPDWEIGKDTYIETKGYFTSADRTKTLAFLKQWPNVKLYLLFGNADNKLNKKSETTYGQWCEKNGIEYSDIRRPIPRRWWKLDGGGLQERVGEPANVGNASRNKQRGRKC